MKKVLLFMLLAATVTINGQPVAAKVYYKQVLNLDSGSSMKNSTGKRALLYFSDTLSYYVYNSTKTADPTQQAGSQDGSITYDINGQDDVGEVFMTDFKRRRIFIREFVWQNPYTTIDTLININWILTSEQKQLGKFSCQKAVGVFRGRTFDAWFTSAIPSRAGPWKLQGLPGLILEAADSKKQVQYLFDGIELPNTEISLLKIPGKGKSLPLIEYRNLWRVETAKIKKFLEATAEKGTTVEVGIDYFPMELSYEP